MEEWGNKRANEYYEANLPAHVVRPKEGDAVRVVERFIRDKYEHKRYMGKIPPKNSEATAAPVAQELARRASTATTPVAARTPAVAPKPSPAPAPAPAPSLLDFDEPVLTPAAPVVAAPVFDPFAAPAPVQAAPAHHEFGAFTSAPSHAPPPAPHNVSHYSFLISSIVYSSSYIFFRMTSVTLPRPQLPHKDGEHQLLHFFNQLLLQSLKRQQMLSYPCMLHLVIAEACLVLWAWVDILILE